jgi:hypothetical protein
MNNIVDDEVVRNDDENAHQVHGFQANITTPSALVSQ